MLQNAPIGAQHKRVATHFEYNTDLTTVYFNPSHQGPNDFTACQRVRRVHSLLDSFRKILELTNDRMQFAAQCLLIG
jgi:hypothetical protein